MTSRVSCDSCGDWACATHGGHIGERCSCWPCDDCGDLFEELDEHDLCAECAKKEGSSDDRGRDLRVARPPADPGDPVPGGDRMVARQ